MAIRAGFTSVMVDRSKLPYEENVAQVKEVVRMAHAVGVSAEAELGHVGIGSNYAVDGVSNFTDPELAKKFVEETQIDALAVAIGTAHGLYKGEPKLQFDLLEQIVNSVDIPLVLHGGSGTGDENLARACRSGINKVNLSTDMKYAALQNLKKVYPIGEGEENIFGFWRLLQEGFKDALRHYVKVCGSEGKA
ncbi:fructose-bisphosphate aldolase, class II [Pelolinea submarina]|nr:fructose-bisphosphate aldolase, class II [Pelolinea submarina]